VAHEHAADLARPRDIDCEGWQWADVADSRDGGEDLLGAGGIAVLDDVVEVETRHLRRARGGGGVATLRLDLSVAVPQECVDVLLSAVVPEACTAASVRAHPRWHNDACGLGQGDKACGDRPGHEVGTRPASDVGRRRSRL
jgi:hypothetical protein